jgi:hypothetical protein
MAILLLVMIAAVGLRAIAIDGEGLWVDEGYTAWTSFLSGEAHAIARQHDDAPPLYYALQRVLLPHLPPGEGSVRLLSILASLATIAWLLARPPFPRARIPSAVLFGLGAFGVYYARQARSYALLMLFAVVLLTATARFLRGERRWIILVPVAEALALWTHNVAATLVVGVNLAWLLGGRREPRRWIAAQAVAGVFWLPYILGSPPQFAVHASLNRWIADYWGNVPLAVAPLLSLAAFAGGAHVSPLPLLGRWTYTGPGSAIVAVAAFGAVLFFLGFAFRSATRREAWIAASFTLAPLAALAVLSRISAPSYIVGRTDAVAYVGFVVWMALGWSSSPRRARWAAAAVLGITTILTLATNFPVEGRGRANDRAVGRRLQSVARPGDTIVYVGLSRPSIDYYVTGGRPGRERDGIKRAHFPAIFGDNPAAVYPIPGDSLPAWEEEARRLRRRFEETATSGEAALFFVGPIKPDRGLTDPTAADLTYPGSILAYVINGLRPLDPVLRLRGDGMGIDWILFRVEKDRLVPLQDLQPIEGEP